MNLIQIIKKSRLGVDSILPGGRVSSQWSDEEMVDLVNTALDEVWRRFRLARKKHGLLSVKQSDSAFTRDGETYTPATSLQITSSTNKITLPPDYGELVRVLCIDNRSVRFFPADMESFHWIDVEQSAQDDSGNLLLSTPDHLVLYFDIIGSRTLIFIPPISTTLNLQIDYIPLKRPLYYSTTGVASQTGTALTGVGTVWVDDNIYTEDTGNAAEFIALNDAFSSIEEITDSIRLDKDYPRVASFTSNTVAVMVASATVASTPFIMAMAPSLPRDIHRWIAQYVSALMLQKINPELSQKYGAEVLKSFDESIRPTAGRRQSQESTVTEDAAEFGAADF